MPTIATYDQLPEIADRSEMHARAVNLVVQIQQQYDRQRRIWELRAEERALTERLSLTRSQLEAEQSEQERDAKLFEISSTLMERAGGVTVE